MGDALPVWSKAVPSVKIVRIIVKISKSDENFTFQRRNFRIFQIFYLDIPLKLNKHCKPSRLTHHKVFVTITYISQTLNRCMYIILGIIKLGIFFRHNRMKQSIPTTNKNIVLYYCLVSLLADDFSGVISIKKINSEKIVSSTKV